MYMLFSMSHPSGHLAAAGGGRAALPVVSEIPGPGQAHHSRSDSGASSKQASAAALHPYTLSLTSGCRTFELYVPTPNGLFFEHQDAIDRVSLSDASSYEAFKEKFSLRFEWLQSVVRGTLRSALLDSGFVLGSVIDHDFDELAYDFKPYAVYEVLHRMAVTSDLILFCRGWTRLTVFLYPGNTSFSIARLCMTGT